MNIFNLTKQNLSFFGWLSIVMGIVSIPYLAISFMAGLTNPNQSYQPNVIGSLISIAFNLIYVAILYFFKVLLNNKYKFTGANKSINSLIYVSLLVVVGIEALSYISGTEGLRLVVSALSFVVLGIISIAIGVKLLSLSNSLYGIKKSLSISLISSGVMFASIVLFFLALIPSIIIDVLIGVIFLREASTLKK